MAGLLWLIFNHKVADNAWSKIIDQNLLPLLLNQGSASQQGKLALWLLATAWFIGAVALANPVWEKKPRPVFQTNTARVIVFDLSRSMEIADLAPSRVARARFKIEDILRKKEEGQIGLVVFAGDAFTAVPLTRDAETIRTLLPSLMPKIMPIQGSRADLGLLKAAELLQQAGVSQGEILLISDGVEGDLAQQAAQEIVTQGHTISVMAVGTEKGGAIPHVTDGQRKPIIVKLETKDLQAVAKYGGGAYSPLQDDDSDLDQLLTSTHKGEKEKQGSHSINSTHRNDWHEQGPLFVLLLLPLAALAFRRGWLFTLPLILIISSQPRPALALGWDDLWLRADQQADKAFRSGEFETASKVAQDPMLRGNAAYQQKNYQQAVDDFSTKTDANALYNKGNALAKLGQYKEAIAAYDETLQQQTDFADATTNKKYVTALLKKQEEEEKKQQKNKKDDKKSSEKGDKKSDQSSDKNKEQQGKDQENKSSEKKSDQQQANDSNDKDKNDKNAFDKAAKEQEAQKKEEEPSPEEQAAQQTQKNQQNEQKQSSKEQPQGKNKQSATTSEKEQKAKQLNREEKIAADQWLRRIQDNPGDLLQRKFKYQYQQRQAPEGTIGSNPW